MSANFTDSRLNAILNSTKIITIFEGFTNEFNPKTGELMWSPLNDQILTLENRGDIYGIGKESKIGRDSDLNLAHELLGHGFQFLNGDLNYNYRLNWRENGRLISRIPNVEADAANISSVVALQTGRFLMISRVYEERFKLPDGGITYYFHMVPMFYNMYDSSARNPAYFKRWPN